MNFSKINSWSVVITAIGLSFLNTGCGSSSNTTSTLSGTASTTGLTSTGCAPITGIIGFSATNAYVDSANIYAVSGKTGSITVGTASAAGGSWGNTWNTSVSDAYVYMTPANTVATTSSYYYGSAGAYPYSVGSFSPYYSSYYSSSNYMTLSGTIQLTSARLAVVESELGSANTGVCVESIAIAVGHYNTELYGGWIYLYLNNGDYIPLEL
jgi:hypothetical protein